MAIIQPTGTGTPRTSADGTQHYTPALVTLAVLYFMMGFITCLNDTLVPFFKEGFTLSNSQSALVQFYFFLTYGIMSVPAGRIVERLGYKKGMVSGFALAGAGALLFFPASVFHQYSLFLAALFVLAMGIVLLQVAANPYVTVLGPPETASSRFTLIQGVGSVGTTVAPLFGAYFILSRLQESGTSGNAVSAPYVGIGIFLFVIALVIARLSLPAIGSERQQTTGNALPQRSSIFRFRNFNFGLVGIFMYVGAEVAIGTFLTNYIADTLRVEEHVANTYLALYWGGMLAGRLIGSLVLKTVKPQVVLSVVAVAAIVLMIISISTGGYIAVWSMIAVGLCNSVMFAVIFSLSVCGLGDYTIRASGWLSTAIVGGAVIPYLQGLIRDAHPWGVAFLLPMACYGYIVFYGMNGYKPGMKASNK